MILKIFSSNEGDRMLIIVGANTKMVTILFLKISRCLKCFHRSEISFIKKEESSIKVDTKCFES